jgi:hypothetical protein
MHDNSKVFLKKFGTININKEVDGYKVGNLWYVYIYGDWHYVPLEDAEPIE